MMARRAAKLGVAAPKGGVALLAAPVAALGLLLVLPLIEVVRRAFALDGLEGLTGVVTDAIYQKALLRTLAMTLVVTACTWLLSMVYVLAVLISGKKLRVLLLGVLVGSFWISLLVRTYGWMIIETPNGALDQLLQSIGLTSEPLNLLGTTIGMYPATIHVLMPYMALPLLASVWAIDGSLIRAAQSLGAGPWRIFRTVIMPQLKNGSIAGITLVFILSFGFYITPAFIGGPSDLTVATLISRSFNEVFDADLAAAQATVLLIVVTVMYLVADRLFHVNEQLERQ